MTISKKHQLQEEFFSYVWGDTEKFIAIIKNNHNGQQIQSERCLYKGLNSWKILLS